MEIKLEKIQKKFNSREMAHKVVDSEVTAESVVLNFAGVEEATPSFCHELLSIFVDKKTKIRVINANDQIKLQINKARAAFV